MDIFESFNTIIETYKIKQPVLQLFNIEPYEEYEQVQSIPRNNTKMPIIVDIDGSFLYYEQRKETILEEESDAEMVSNTSENEIMSSPGVFEELTAATEKSEKGDPACVNNTSVDHTDINTTHNLYSDDILLFSSDVPDVLKEVYMERNVGLNDFPIWSDT